MRQVVLDTETTGLEPSQGHRIIEIGCIELVNRRTTGKDYHQYIRPDREVDEGAVNVHGITTEFLADKPAFEEISEDFLNFIEGAELIIHNAPFDVAFINAELERLDLRFVSIEERCTVLDTLELARKKHPGQKNNLDALCKRYEIDNSERDFHGALLDARILADVYLAMTGGQVSLSLRGDFEPEKTGSDSIKRLSSERAELKIIHANEAEDRVHNAWLLEINEASGGNCIWLNKAWF